MEGELLTTIDSGIIPEELFENLIIGKNGYLHLDGLVVKKNAFERSGYFPVHLRLHQDTAIFIQLAATAKLIAGRLDIPVANRGIHEENRILSDYDQRKTKHLLWKTLFYWSVYNRLSIRRKAIIFKLYLKSLLRLVRKNNSLISRIQNIYQIVLECVKHPIVLFCVLKDTIVRR